MVVAIIGLLFIIAALLSLIRLRQLRWSIAYDALFLVGLAVTLAFQLAEGVDVLAQPRDASAVQTIASLVVVCALIGIARSWELIGGPEIGLWKEFTRWSRDGRCPATRPTRQNAAATRTARAE